MSFYLKFLIFFIFIFCFSTSILANNQQYISWDDRLFADVREVSMGDILTSKTRMDGDEMIDFRLKVVSIDNRYVKRQYILAEIEDKLFQEIGVLRGMSGSPVYFKGRLVGAVSATQAFLKKPMAIITPIRAMLGIQKYLKEYEENPNIPNISAMSMGKNNYSRSSRQSSYGGDDFFSTFFSSWRQKFFHTDSAGDDFDRERKVTVLPKNFAAKSDFYQIFSHFRKTAVVNIDALSRNFIAENFDFSFSSSSASGAKSLGLSQEQFNQKATSLEPGDYVGINLMRGDMNITAYGTVTYVDKGLVFAFGHSMASNGFASLPLYKAYVNGVMPSVIVSSKVGSLIKEIGVIKQDHFVAIAGRLGEKARYVPIKVNYTEKGLSVEDGDFSFEVAADPNYMSFLSYEALMSIFMQHGSGILGGHDSHPEDSADMYSFEYSIEGKTLNSLGKEEKSWKLVNKGFVYKGWRLGEMEYLLRGICNNFYKNVRIDDIKVKVNKIPNQTAFLKDVRLAKGNGIYKKGETVDLIVSYRFYRGEKTIQKRIGYVLPNSLDPGVYNISISNEKIFFVEDYFRNRKKYAHYDFDSFMKNYQILSKRGEKNIFIALSPFSAGLKMPGRSPYRGEMPFSVNARLNSVGSSKKFLFFEHHAQKEEIANPLYGRQFLKIEIIE